MERKVKTGKRRSRTSSLSQTGTVEISTDRRSCSSIQYWYTALCRVHSRCVIRVNPFNAPPRHSRVRESWAQRTEIRFVCLVNLFLGCRFRVPCRLSSPNPRLLCPGRKEPTPLALSRKAGAGAWGADAGQQTVASSSATSGPVTRSLSHSQSGPFGLCLVGKYLPFRY